MKEFAVLLALLGTITPRQAYGRVDLMRRLSGLIVTEKNEPVSGVALSIRGAAGELRATSDAAGRFSVMVWRESLTLRIEGKNVEPLERHLGPEENSEDLEIRVRFIIQPVHDTVVIVSSALDPGIDLRNGVVYRETVFSRDDQVFHTLDAGIDARQHEGGAKSVEIRRFGFNLDHGGLSGGLKVLVDDVQQN